MNSGIKVAFVALVSVVVGACNGWPDATESRQAINQPEKYLTYAATPADSVPVFVAEHHRYMVMPTPTHLRLGKTRQVGTAAGASVFALEGDAAPYSNLFVRTTTGEWRSVGVID